MPAKHHIHRIGIPRLGGVAIFVAFSLLFALGAVTGTNAQWRRQIIVFAPAAMLFLVGLVDDFRCLPAKLKLVFQIVGGIFLFVMHVRLFETTNLHVMSVNIAPSVSFLATIAWVVLVTNAFNLIDGLDGLAAGAALFSITALFGLALADHDAGVAFTTLLLGGAVLGFLRYNFNPATIFLGDSGSLFLGFMLSGLALQPKNAAAPTLVAVATPLLSFGVPVTETVVSVIRRFLGGKSLFAPDRNHIHHRLLKLGFSQRQAVIILYAVCAGCALLSLFLRSNRPLVGLILVVAGTIVCFGIQSLGYLEFSEFTRLAQRGVEQKKIIPNNIAIRNVAQMLNGCKSWPEVTKALDLLLRIGEFDSYALLLKDEITVRRVLIKGAVRDNASPDDWLGNGTHGSAKWAVTMDLHVGNSRRFGCFSIGRVFRRRNLFVDMNLVFGKLEPALSRACERIKKSEPVSKESTFAIPRARTTTEVLHEVTYVPDSDMVK